MTTSDLINLLESVDPDTEVRLAMQPSWPFEYSIGEVIEINPKNIPKKSIIYLSEERQIGYLPKEVQKEIGW